jgi:hypothetical protein
MNLEKQEVTIDLRGVKFVGYLTEEERKQAIEVVKFLNDFFVIQKD